MYGYWFLYEQYGFRGTMIRHCPNWFSYFLKILLKYPVHFMDIWFQQKKKIPCSQITLKSNKNPNFVYAYNRKTFNRFCKVKKQKETCKKYLKIHSNIEKYIDHLKSKIFTQEGENLKYIGIHYRGTDKIAEKELPEENPIHYEYNRIYDILKNKKETMEEQGHNVYIVVTTDEQPFIDFLVDRFDDKVLYYKEGLRSTINTS